MTDNDKPHGVEEPEPEDSAPEVEPESKRGQVRFQDAETTTPREATVGEKRARRRALQREQEEELAAHQEVERKSRLRKRILIGGGVTVGVVALVAVWYAAATPDEVTAHCVADDNTVATVEDTCDENYVSSHGGYHSGGFFFLPIAGGGYRQYHYNYGGSVSNGRVTGGSTAAPSGNTRVKTSSGRTVQRGGLGVSSGGKSGGKSGGSSGGS